MRHYGKQMISVQVTNDLKQRLWAIADEMGLSLSDIVRMCLTRGLDEMERTQVPTRRAP